MWRPYTGQPAATPSGRAKAVRKVVAAGDELLSRYHPPVKLTCSLGLARPILQGVIQRAPSGRDSETTAQTVGTCRGTNCVEDAKCLEEAICSKDHASASEMHAAWSQQSSWHRCPEGELHFPTVHLKFLFEALAALLVCDQAAHLFEVACMVLRTKSHLRCAKRLRRSQ